MSWRNGAVMWSLGKMCEGVLHPRASLSRFAMTNGAVGMFDGSYSGSFQRFQRSSSFKQGSITSVLPPSRETCVSVAHMQLSCPVHCPEQDRTAIFSPILLNGRAGTVFGVCILEVADRFLLAPQKHPVPACNRVFLWSQQKAISYFQYTHTKNSPCTAIQKDGRENGCPVLLRAVNRTRQLHVSDRNARFSRGG